MQVACADTNTADVNSLPRSEVLALRCLLSRDSQTVPQWVLVRRGCHCRCVLCWTLTLDPNITFFNVQGKNEDWGQYCLVLRSRGLLRARILGGLLVGLTG